MQLLDQHEQARLTKLVRWNTFREGLDSGHSQELRNLVAKQYPREAQQYKVEKVVYLAVGMVAAYAILSSVNGD